MTMSYLGKLLALPTEALTLGDALGDALNDTSWHVAAGTITCRCQKCVAAAEARTGPSIGSEWPLPPLKTDEAQPGRGRGRCTVVDPGRSR